MDSSNGFFAGINSILQPANFPVGSESEAFVRTIQIVRNNLSETERLLGIRTIQTQLISTPSKLKWINDAISSAKSALNDISKWVERARLDQQTLGKGPYQGKVRGALKDHDRLLSHKTELLACHQQLSNVLRFIVPLEQVLVATEPLTYQAASFFDGVLAPRQPRNSDLGRTQSRVRPGETAMEYSRNITTPENTLPPTARASAYIHTPSKNMSSEVDAPPPRYTAFEETVLDSTPTSVGHVEPPKTSQSLSRASVNREARETGHTEHNQHTMLSHNKSLALRGTNRYGPVDQFELFPGHITEKSHGTHKAKTVVQSKPAMLGKVPTELPAEPPSRLPAELPAEPPSRLPAELPSELPSELPAELPRELPIELPLELPAELPTKNLGPASNYPRIIVRKPVPEPPTHVAHRPEAQALRRQTKPACRPTSSTWHFNSNPPTQTPTFRYEMEDASSSVSLLPTARSASMSSVCSAPSPMPSPTSSSIQHGRHGVSNSVSVIPSPRTTSTSLAPNTISPISSPPLPSASSGHKWQTARPRPGATLSSTRPRRKSYLDLFGSIETGR